LTTAVCANSSRANAGSSPAKSRGWASRRARPRVTWGRNGRASVEYPSGANSCSTRCCRISSPGSGAIPAHTTRGRRKSGNTPNPAGASARVRAPAAVRPSAAVISASRSSPTSPRNLSVRWMPSPRTQFTGSPSSRSGAVAAHSASRTAGGRFNATNSLTRSRGKPARRAGCRGGSPAGRARFGEGGADAGRQPRGVPRAMLAQIVRVGAVAYHGEAPGPRLGDQPAPQLRLTEEAAVGGVGEVARVVELVRVELDEGDIEALGHGAGRGPLRGGIGRAPPHRRDDPLPPELLAEHHREQGRIDPAGIPHQG